RATGSASALNLSAGVPQGCWRDVAGHGVTATQWHGPRKSTNLALTAGERARALVVSAAPQPAPPGQHGVSGLLRVGRQVVRDGDRCGRGVTDQQEHVTGSRVVVRSYDGIRV